MTRTGNYTKIPEDYRDAKVPERARQVVRLAKKLGWFVDHAWDAERHNGEPFYRLAVKSPAGKPYLFAYMVWYSVPESDGVQLEKRLFRCGTDQPWQEFRFLSDLEKAMTGSAPLVNYSRP